MSHRIDHGYAAIKPEADGTKTVAIGSGVRNGRLTGMFAQYARVASLAIGPDVRLDEHAGVAVTTTRVAVLRTSTGQVEVRSVA